MFADTRLSSFLQPQSPRAGWRVGISGERDEEDKNRMKRNYIYAALAQFLIFLSVSEISCTVEDSWILNSPYDAIRESSRSRSRMYRPTRGRLLSQTEHYILGLSIM